MRKINAADVEYTGDDIVFEGVSIKKGENLNSIIKKAFSIMSKLSLAKVDGKDVSVPEAIENLLSTDYGRAGKDVTYGGIMKIQSASGVELQNKYLSYNMRTTEAKAIIAYEFPRIDGAVVNTTTVKAYNKDGLVARTTRPMSTIEVPLNKFPITLDVRMNGIADNNQYTMEAQTSFRASSNEEGAIPMQINDRSGVTKTNPNMDEVADYLVLEINRLKQDFQNMKSTTRELMNNS